MSYHYRCQQNVSCRSSNSSCVPINYVQISMYFCNICICFVNSLLSCLNNCYSPYIQIVRTCFNTALGY